MMYNLWHEQNTDFSGDLHLAPDLFQIDLMSFYIQLLSEPLSITL